MLLRFSSQKNRKIKDEHISQFAFLYDVDSMLIPPKNRSCKNIFYIFKDTKTEYNLELRIPWKEMGINPNKRKSIPINIEADDCDKTDNEKGIYYGRDISVSWSPKSCRLLVFKQIILTLYYLNKKY